MTDPGKRRDTAEPLTAHDVADRLDKAALRVWRIMLDARQIPGLMDEVKGSRYLSNALAELAGEIEAWGIRPARADRDEQPIPDAAAVRALRAQGMTWEQVGDALGTTAQGAHAIASREPDPEG